MAAPDTMTVLQESTLVAQLRALAHLTQSEAQIAKIRIAQARTDEVRGELLENSRNATRRTRRITAALRGLDAVPDVVTPALGRVLAFAKATVEQVQPLDEALLGDLALEHQLLDRARYVRGVAEHLDRRDVVALADDLVVAHTETVDWIHGVLDQESTGGPAALRPTPIQRVSGGVLRLAGFPARVAVERVNRLVDVVIRGGEAVGEQVQDTARSVTHTAAELADDARDIAVAGRDAALARTEQVAASRGADTTAAATDEVRAELGGLTTAELPVAGYDELSAVEAIAAIRDLTDVDDIRALLAYEESHRNRVTVTTAAMGRADGLAGSDH